MDKCQNDNVMIYNILPYSTELLGEIGSKRAVLSENFSKTPCLSSKIKQKSSILDLISKKLK